MFRPEHVMGVSFQYGSRHNIYEKQAAQKVADFYQIHHKIIDLTSFMCDFNSALMKSGENLPHGHYEEESMRKTVVPGRNLIFTSILAGIAESVGAKSIALGVHAGDHFIYPDCRPEFIYSAQKTIGLSSDGKVNISAPYLDKTKDEIVAVGLHLGVPFELTRTCYADQIIACGKCGSCQERLTAFKANGMEDPLMYESRELIAPTKS